MKCILFLCLLISGVAYGQTTYLIQADSTKLRRVGGNNELILENGTRGTTGVLVNYGNGRTRFSKPRIVGDTLFIGVDTILGVGATTPTWQQSLATTGGHTISTNHTVDFTNHSFEWRNLTGFTITQDFGATGPTDIDFSGIETFSVSTPSSGGDLQLNAIDGTNHSNIQVIPGALTFTQECLSGCGDTDGGNYLFPNLNGSTTGADGFFGHISSGGRAVRLTTGSGLAIVGSQLVNTGLTSTPTLQQVTDAGNTTDNNMDFIFGSGSSIGIGEAAGNVIIGIDNVSGSNASVVTNSTEAYFQVHGVGPTEAFLRANADSSFLSLNTFGDIGMSFIRQSDVGLNIRSTKKGTGFAELTWPSISTIGSNSWTYQLPNKSGTIAMTSDITGGSPAGNFGNLQINRNGAFSTPASDSLGYTASAGLNIKNGINLVSGSGTNQTINWGANYDAVAAMLYDGGPTSQGGWGFRASDMQFFIANAWKFSFNKGGVFNAAGTNEMFVIDAQNSLVGSSYPVAINHTGTISAPDASAVLDASSTTKGFLPPRMTTAQRTAISSPAEGLQVYDLTLHKTYTWDGTTWQAHW